jgi:molybdopterin/thiamine biosynthesis adenylyltransferase
MGKVVGIAGCGGMGGQLGSTLLRLGVKEVRIADPEFFDISNLNRQFAAKISTIGKSKAFETAKMIREISTDMDIEIYPMGITEDLVSDFVFGCDLIVDEIEIWEQTAPILLHQASRRLGVSVLSCNTASYGTHIFLFTPTSMTLEEVFGVTLDEAKKTDEKRRKNGMSKEEIQEFVDKLLLVIAPELKNYNPEEFPRIVERLVKEQKASIISTNPVFATGFLADRILFELFPELLGRKGARIPEMPGYAYMDARSMEGKVFIGKWW